MSPTEKILFLRKLLVDAEQRKIHAEVMLKVLQNAELSGTNVGESKNQIRQKIKMAEAEAKELIQMIDDEVSSLKTTRNT